MIGINKPCRIGPYLCYHNIGPSGCTPDHESRQGPTTLCLGAGADGLPRNYIPSSVSRYLPAPVATQGFGGLMLARTFGASARGQAEVRPQGGSGCAKDEGLAAIGADSLFQTAVLPAGGAIYLPGGILD